MGKEIFCWKGFRKEKDRLPSAQQTDVDAAIRKLVHGEVRVLRLTGQDEVYKLKVNKRCRVLLLKNPKDTSQLIAVTVTADHNYDRALNTLKSFQRKNSSLDNLFKANRYETTENEQFTFKDNAQEGVKLVPVEYHNEQFIVLNDKQQQVLQLRFPLLLGGPPGSGKTTMLLFTLVEQMKQLLQENPKASALFLTPTKALAQSVNELFREMPESQGIPAESVRIIAYEGLLQAQGCHNLVGQVYFQQWFTEYYEHYLTTQKNKQGGIALSFFKESDAIYQEMRFIAGLTSKQEYLAVSETKHSFKANKQQREWLWDSLQAYLNHLAATPDRVHPDFYAPKTTSAFDLVVVDELQTYTLLQTRWFFEQLARGKRVIGASNDQQRDQGNDSILPYVLHLFNDNYHQLSISYRCPGRVMEAAIKLTRMRDHCVAGAANKIDEPLVVSPEQQQNPGEFKVFAANSQVDMNKVVQALQKPKTAVFTQAHLVKEAKDVLKAAVVFELGIEAIGLELDGVVLYKGMGNERFYHANKMLEGADLAKVYRNLPPADKGDKRVAAAFNQVFVAATRAMQRFIIVTDNEDSHRLKNIIGPLKELVAQEKQVVTSVSSPSEVETAAATRAGWEEMHAQLVAHGHTEQAADVMWMHLGKPVPESASTSVKTNPGPVQQETKKKRKNHKKPATSALPAKIAQVSPQKINQLLTRYEKEPSIELLIEIINLKSIEALFNKNSLKKVRCLLDITKTTLPLWEQLLSSPQHKQTVMGLFAAAVEPRGLKITLFPLSWMTSTYPNLGASGFGEIARIFKELLIKKPDLIEGISDYLKREVKQNSDRANKIISNLAEDGLQGVLDTMVTKKPFLFKLLIEDWFVHNKSDFVIEIMKKLVKTKLGQKILTSLITQNKDNEHIVCLFLPGEEKIELFVDFLISQNWEPLNSLPINLFVSNFLHVNLHTKLSPLYYIARHERGAEIIERLVKTRQLAQYITVDMLCQKNPRGPSFHSLFYFLISFQRAAESLGIILKENPALIRDLPVDLILEVNCRRQLAASIEAMSLLRSLMENPKFLQALTPTVLTTPLSPNSHKCLLSNLAGVIGQSDENDCPTLDLLLTKKPELVSQIPLSKFFFTAKTASEAYSSVFFSVVANRSSYSILEKFSKDIDKFCQEITAEALFSTVNSPVYTTAFHGLCCNERGIRLLRQIFNHRPDILDKVTPEQVTKRVYMIAPYDEVSIFYLLVNEEEGIEILKSLFARHKEIAKRINLEDLLFNDYSGKYMCYSAWDILNASESGIRLLADIPASDLVSVFRPKNVVGPNTFFKRESDLVNVGTIRSGLASAGGKDLVVPKVTQ